MTNPERRLRRIEEQSDSAARNAARANSRPAMQMGARLGFCLGKAITEIDSGTSGEVQIWDGPEGSETNTSQVITCFAKFGSVGHATDDAQRWCLVIRMRGKNYAIPPNFDGGEEGGAEVVVFELTATLSLAGEAAAVICTVSAGEYAAGATAITVCDPYQSPGCWTGLAGYRGVACKRSDDKYDILFMERKALIVEFELDEDMSLGSADATVLYDYQQGNKSPGATIVVDDPIDLFANGVTGDKGLAIYNDERAQYDIITPRPHDSNLFVKLTATLNQGSSTTANPIVWGGAAFVVDNEATVTVYDIFLNDGESVPSGTVCACVWYEDDWVVSSFYCAVNDILAND